MAEFVTVEEHKEFARRIESEEARQNHRLELLEETVREMQKVVISVEKLALSIDNMAKEIQRQGDHLEKLESEPADKWKKAVWLVVSALIGAATAMFIKNIGL